MTFTLGIHWNVPSSMEICHGFIPPPAKWYYAQPEKHPDTLELDIFKQILSGKWYYARKLVNCLTRWSLWYWYLDFCVNNGPWFYTVPKMISCTVWKQSSHFRIIHFQKYTARTEPIIQWKFAMFSYRHAQAEKTSWHYFQKRIVRTELTIQWNFAMVLYRPAKSYHAQPGRLKELESGTGWLLIELVGYR